MMNIYEHLMTESPVSILEAELPDRFKGLYIEWAKEGRILIAKRIRSRREKNCILAEEIGHHFKTVGDITDQTKLENRQQERRALSWAYERLVPLSALKVAYEARISGRFELAGFLDVTEDFLCCAIRYYKEKYGIFTHFGDKHVIYFDPLGVMEIFE